MKMNGRKAMTRSRGTKGYGMLSKDAGGRSVPGFTGGESAATWPARTGYTQSGENKIGASDKGRSIPLPSKDS